MEHAVYIRMFFTFGHWMFVAMLIYRPFPPPLPKEKRKTKNIYLEKEDLT